MFLTIVDLGWLVAAARKLGRATPVISYSIADPDAQLTRIPTQPARACSPFRLIQGRGDSPSASAP